MPETIAAPAPAAASTPATASSPAPAAAPSAPAAAPASTPAAAQPTFGSGSGVTSHVDPAQFGTNTQAYAKAVLAEQLGSVAVEEAPAPVTEETAAVVEPVAEPVVAPE